MDDMRREIKLADGRVLDAWIDPDSAGLPLVFHYGTPGGGLPYGPHVEAARQRGLRWISWSRPGYGTSTRLEGRNVAHVAADARQVLDQLGAQKAYVAGWSGGGPHALACAALMPDRVLGVSTVASGAPFDAEDLDYTAGMGAENVEAWEIAQAGPEADAAEMDDVWPKMRDVTGADVADQLGDLLSDVDRGVLSGDFAEWLAANTRDGLRDSYLGWLDDDMTIVQPWGVGLSSFAVPVHIWQGEHDRMVPFTHGQWLTGHVHGACPHLLSDHGHLSLAVDSFGMILDEMLAPTR